MANSGQLAAESDAHAAAEEDRELLELAAEQVVVRGTSCTREIDPVAVSIDQVISQAHPAVESAHVELRQQEIAGPNQFQLALLDFPPLGDELGAAGDGFGDGVGPIEVDAGHGRLVAGADQAAVARADAHQEPQLVFVVVQVAEGLGNLRLEVEVLFAGLGLFLTGSGTLVEPLILHPPQHQRAVAAQLGGFQVAIGQIEIPVTDLDVVQLVLHLGIQAHNFNVLPDPPQYDRHAVDLHASAAEQGVAGFDFQRRCPEALQGLELAATGEAAVARVGVAESEDGAIRRLLGGFKGQAAGLGLDVADEADVGDIVRDVLRAVRARQKRLVRPGAHHPELRVKLRQGGFGAGADVRNSAIGERRGIGLGAQALARIAAHNRRIENRGDVTAAAEAHNRAFAALGNKLSLLQPDRRLSASQDLRVGQTDGDHFFQREIPHFPGLGVAQGERSFRVLDIRERLEIEIGHRSRRRLIDVMRQVAVFVQEKRLGGRTSAQCREQADEKDARRGDWPSHRFPFLGLAHWEMHPNRPWLVRETGRSHPGSRSWLHGLKSSGETERCSVPRLSFRPP